MFDLGWIELLIIGVVALIVVGPKDLPVMFKTIGRFVGKAKRMARDFQATMNAAASETGLKETTDLLKNIDRSGNSKEFLKAAAGDILAEKEENLENKVDKEMSTTKLNDTSSDSSKN